MKPIEEITKADIEKATPIKVTKPNQNYIGKTIVKRSLKPFKSGSKSAVVKGFMEKHPYTGKLSFILTDYTYIEVQKCKLCPEEFIVPEKNMLEEVLKVDKILHVFALLFICLIITFLDDSAINHGLAVMQIQDFDFSEHRGYAIPTMWILTILFSIYVFFKVRKK